MEIRLMRPASVSQAPNEAGSASDYQGLFARYGAPDHGGAGSGGVVFLCIANARRELPLLPHSASGRASCGRLTLRMSLDWQLRGRPLATAVS